MMGGRTWDDWIEEYSESHQNPINRLMHTFGIPMIALSVLLLPVCKPPEFLKDYRFLFVGLRWWFKKVLGANSN